MRFASNSKGLGPTGVSLTKDSLAIRRADRTTCAYVANDTQSRSTHRASGLIAAHDAHSENRGSSSFAQDGQVKLQ